MHACVSRWSWWVSVWSVCLNWCEACLLSWCNWKHDGRVSLKYRLESRRGERAFFPQAVNSIFRLSLTHTHTHTHTHTYIQTSKVKIFQMSQCRCPNQAPATTRQHSGRQDTRTVFFDFQLCLKRGAWRLKFNVQERNFLFCMTQMACVICLELCQNGNDLLTQMLRVECSHHLCRNKSGQQLHNVIA